MKISYFFHWKILRHQVIKAAFIIVKWMLMITKRKTKIDDVARALSQLFEKFQNPNIFFQIW